MKEDIPDWMIDPRSGAPLEERAIRKARKSTYYQRFTSIINSVPVMRTRKQGWRMLSTIYEQMDFMKAFRSQTNAINAQLALRVAIIDSQLAGGVKGSGCLMNRYYDNPTWA